MKKFNKNIKFITYFISIGSILFLLAQKVMAQEMNNELGNFRQAAYGPAPSTFGPNPNTTSGEYLLLLKFLFFPIIFIIGIIFFIKHLRRNKKKLNAQKNSQNGKI
ncbi:MAG: hypothetical protein PHG83_00790 [Patescibacteria group bacterium]|nr:hypothetical protein [Patescibacteria group bacterium]